MPKPPTKVLAAQLPLVRLPLELAAAVDEMAKEIQAERPGSNVSRTEAVRALLLEAIAARRARKEGAR